MRLKKLREGKKLQKSELANILGIKRNTYSAWELGYSEPNIENLKKLADYFEVSIDYLTERNGHNIFNKMQEKDLEEIKRFIDFLNTKD